jgi:hypothetical protein
MILDDFGISLSALRFVKKLRGATAGKRRKPKPRRGRAASIQVTVSGGKASVRQLGQNAETEATLRRLEDAEDSDDAHEIKVAIAAAERLMERVSDVPPEMEESVEWLRQRLEDEEDLKLSLRIRASERVSHKLQVYPHPRTPQCPGDAGRCIAHRAEVAHTHARAVLVVCGGGAAVVRPDGLGVADHQRCQCEGSVGEPRPVHARGLHADAHAAVAGDGDAGCGQGTARTRR